MTLVDQIRTAAGWPPPNAMNGNGTARHSEPSDSNATAGATFVPLVQQATLVPASIATDGDGALPETSDDDSTSILASSPDSQNVVHDVLKGLDVWFAYEVSGLEREAMAQAHSWAEHGLPRHDLQFQEPLDVENVLVGRALEIYWTWIRKARRRVTVAINREPRRLSKALTDGVGALDSYRSAERALHELAPRKPDETIRATAAHASDSVNEDPKRSAQLADRRLHGWFWPLMVGLVSVEFVANAPVFTELFPSSIEVENRVNEWLANDTAAIIWVGVRKLGVQLLAAPEPALLAFGLVVFFLFLGHAFGESGRALVVLARPQAVIPESARHGRRRQAWSVLAACSLGIAIMLGVLYIARSRVLPMAEQRLASAQKRVTDAEGELEVAQRAGDQDALKIPRETVWQARDERAHASAAV